ncbi:protein of unknown function [Limnospira indica PCC 8005]|uniref:Uncharacterized protein n=1 Tax=Limnospira indica PCC 8005 TaxID=376219 RepID=A0A9P1KL57_9CYAN|nr:protein of unknown function [Limnospira indica PCC 8005]
MGRGVAFAAALRYTFIIMGCLRFFIFAYFLLLRICQYHNRKRRSMSTP